METQTQLSNLRFYFIMLETCFSALKLCHVLVEVNLGNMLQLITLPKGIMQHRAANFKHGAYSNIVFYLQA